MQFRCCSLAVLLLSASVSVTIVAAEPSRDSLVIVVMDPLAKPLSCPCVAGYAQRDYEKLAAALKDLLGKDVKVVFNESLVVALKKDAHADLVIGKQSVILHDAKRAGVELKKVAMLTGKDGLTTQRGLVVVPATDSATKASDLKDYRIFFGPAECEEKHAAALRLLKEHGVESPTELETAAACDEGAINILELAPKGVRGCAVISSYAKPLLEGCGQVPKGSLKIVGETEEVPFVAAYVNASLDKQVQTALVEGLLKSTLNDFALRKALETKNGFVGAGEAGFDVAKKKVDPAASADVKARPATSADNADWTGWRGANRDAIVAWLPERLPGKEAILWTARMSNSGLAGVAATREVVIVADRDPADRVDIFRCFNADGSDRWTLRYPAPGELDYGNSSRATPLIDGELVFLSGAQGHLHCVELASGKIRWKRHLQHDFDGADKLSWGFCGSPLLADGRLIIQPGGLKSSLVALEPATGEVLWRSPGRRPGHCSPVLATFGGRKQIVGYDSETLGGWDLSSGERLWTLKPKRAGDFNVPTPIVWGEKLIVATENNGARIYGFDSHGLIVPEPLATNDDLLPDCQSPVLAGNRLFGVVAGGLYCLDANRELDDIWHSNDEAFKDYASLIATGQRVLVTTLHGKLILLNVGADKYEPSSELQLLDNEAGLYSHPAVVGQRLYVRGSKSLVCLDLEGGRKP